MHSIWNITLEDYSEAVALAQSRGKVAGEPFEEEFLEIMEKKGKKPCGNTELTQTELLKEITSHGKKALNIETKDGRTIFTIVSEDEQPQ